MRLDEIDPNFAASSAIPQNLQFYNCLEAPFRLYGLLQEEAGQLTRLPKEFEENPTVNPGVKTLLHNTSGGRIRFATNSPCIAVYVELPKASDMVHMPHTGQSGVDVYTNRMGSSSLSYKKTIIPREKAYCGLCEFGAYDKFETHEVLLNLPLYNGVKAIHVGIQEGCHIFAPTEYRFTEPVVYYGSSITQGGCASRPGNTYMGHLSRWLDCDFINLGFSGSARGELAIADYIAGLQMRAFVMDYDANAPTIEHLAQTHYPFYKRIREAQPELPIIMLTFPKYNKQPAFHYFGAPLISRDLPESNQIVLKTYLRALEEGDRNVYYIDGETVFGTEDQDACTVDNCHPNDLGFYRMAKAVLPVLKKVLGV